MSWNSINHGMMKNAQDYCQRKHQCSFQLDQLLIHILYLPDKKGSTVG
jgi:hypothetical protein